MSIVGIDSKYRVTLPSDARKGLPVKVGQEAYVVPYGNAFLVVPLEHATSVELRRKLRELKRKQQEAGTNLLSKIWKPK